MLRIITEDISNAVLDEKKLTITPIQKERTKHASHRNPISKKAKRKLDWDNLPGPSKR